jgi:hypothetical protein
MNQATSPVVEITYLGIELRERQVAGINQVQASAAGSGMTRVRLCDLVAWLAERPGTMIVSIRNL